MPFGNRIYMHPPTHNHHQLGRKHHTLFRITLVYQGKHAGHLKNSGLSSIRASTAIYTSQCHGPHRAMRTHQASNARRSERDIWTVFPAHLNMARWNSWIGKPVGNHTAIWIPCTLHRQHPARANSVDCRLTTLRLILSTISAKRSTSFAATTSVSPSRILATTTSDDQVRRTPSASGPTT